MRFVFIDDDPQSREQWLQWAKRKNHQAWAFSNAYEAKDTPADFIMFDVSACGSGIINTHSAYSPICSLIERFPGAVFVIISGISRGSVEYVIENVKEHSKQGAIVIYGGWGAYKDFEKAIHPYLI